MLHYPKMELIESKMEIIEPKMELIEPKMEMTQPKMEMTQPKMELIEPKMESTSCNSSQLRKTALKQQALCFTLVIRAFNDPYGSFLYMYARWFLSISVKHVKAFYVS